MRAIRSVAISILCILIFVIRVQAAWAPVDLGTRDSFFGVTFVDANIGWAVGADGPVWKTADGGATWIRQPTGMTFTRLAFFLNRDTGWVTGAYSGQIARTEDGGKSWKAASAALPDGFASDARFIDAKTGWAVGRNGNISKSTDGGATWIFQARVASRFLWTVRFVNADTGWAAGEDGALVKTMNGGTRWEQETLPVTSSFQALCFLDRETGWAVGSEGVILKTADGGGHWDRQESGTTQTLHGVDFAGPDTGWAVGEGGVILGTTDGGNHWISQGQTASQALWSVDVVDSRHAWIGGWSGVALKYHEDPAASVTKPGRSPIIRPPGPAFDALGHSVVPGLYPGPEFPFPR